MSCWPRPSNQGEHDKWTGRHPPQTHVLIRTVQTHTPANQHTHYSCASQKPFRTHTAITNTLCKPAFIHIPTTSQHLLPTYKATLATKSSEPLVVHTTHLRVSSCMQRSSNVVSCRFWHDPQTYLLSEMAMNAYVPNWATRGANEAMRSSKSRSAAMPTPGQQMYVTSQFLPFPLQPSVNIILVILSCNCKVKIHTLHPSMSINAPPQKKKKKKKEEKKAVAVQDCTQHQLQIRNHETVTIVSGQAILDWIQTSVLDRAAPNCIVYMNISLRPGIKRLFANMYQFQIRQHKTAYKHQFQTRQHKTACKHVSVSDQAAQDCIQTSVSDQAAQDCIQTCTSFRSGSTRLHPNISFRPNSKRLYINISFRWDCMQTSISEQAVQHCIQTLVNGKH